MFQTIITSIDMPYYLISTTIIIIYCIINVTQETLSSYKLEDRDQIMKVMN